MIFDPLTLGIRFGIGHLAQAGACIARALFNLPAFARQLEQRVADIGRRIVREVVGLLKHQPLRRKRDYPHTVAHHLGDAQLAGCINLIDQRAPFKLGVAGELR